MPLPPNPSTPPGGQQPINPALNPAANLSREAQARLDTQMRKNAEILSKIQSRLNDVTSVRQTMQQGAFNAFGNNFLTRGAMSATGLIGDLLNGENEQSQTPEAQMVSLFKEQMQIMDAVLLENKKHTEVLTNFTETLPSLVYGGNDRSRLNGAPFDSYDYPDQKVMTDEQWDRFMKQMEDSRAHENLQDDKPEPNPFAWMAEQAIHHPASSLPPEQVISVDEIIDSPNKKPKKKTQDVEDVEIKAPVLRIEYEDVKKSFKATEDKSKTPDSLSDASDSVKDSPNPFSSMAKDLYDRSDSKMDAESITEDAEEKDKDRFFKSVVGLLTKIDKKLEPKLSDAKLSSQEDILEAGKNNLDAKIKAMIDSAIKESTQNVAPVDDANNSDDGLGFPDIDIDLPGRKGPRGKKGGTLGRLGKGALRAARFIPQAALIAGVGMAAYDGVSGWNDAEQILGIKDREATTGEKAASALAGIAEGITLGLIDKQVAAKFLTDESKIAPGKPINQEPIYDAMGNFVGMENVDDVPASPDKLEAVNEKVEILDDATDALRRVENQQRSLEKANTDDSGTNGPSINTVNNVTNQTLYAPRRYPNNTEVSFNRYISSAFA